MSTAQYFLEDLVTQLFLKNAKKTCPEIQKRKKIGFGCTREVYEYKKGYVIKYPTCFRGILCNLNEAYSYKLSPTRKAKCRIIYSNGIPLLVMEKVDSVWSHRPDSYWTSERASDLDFEAVTNELPAWCNKLRDGAQVGYNSSGKLVCYDYAWNKTFNDQTNQGYLKTIRNAIKQLAINNPELHRMYNKLVLIYPSLKLKQIY